VFEIQEKPLLVERTLLIGAYFDRREQEDASSLLEELRELVTTLGLPIADCMLVRATERNARTLLGKGKCAELIEHAKALGCDCIIFDNELSPGQQRAWEKDSGLAVIDREEVILDIFNMRAKTAEARLQVDLARMQYSLPRLARMWSHLDRQGGGGGGGSSPAARGEGESQLEIDRRLARRRIDIVKRELAEVKTQRSTQRKERLRIPIPHGAIVGYTNAGKSTLLNSLTGADVLAENKLFATLDTTTRKLQLPDGQQLLVTDTVGFIRKLPHRLVESFKATLEEATVADFLIHVLDASGPRVLEFFQTTMEVLKELGTDDRKMMVVLNKIDLVPDKARLQELASHFHNPVLMSLHTGEGMEEFRHQLSVMLLDKAVRLNVRLPQSRMDLVALIHREGKLISQDYDGNDVLVTMTVPKRLEVKFAPFVEVESKQ
jgi:GTP-binding protein HflX